MSQPPGYIPNKYVFKNENDTARMMNDDGCIFGSCCSILKESQR